MTQILRNPWVRLLASLLALYLLGRGLYGLRDALTPFAVALALAYLLNPPVNALESLLARHLPRLGRPGRVLEPRLVAVGLLCAVVLVAAVVVVLVVIPAGYRQVSEAAGKLPQYAATLRAKVEPLYHRLDLRYPEAMAEARERLVETARSHIPDLLAPVTRGVRAAFSSLLGFVLAVLNLLVIPVFAVYLLYDMNAIRKGAAELVPHRLRPYVSSRMAEVDRLLSAFARGQVTVSAILGTFYAVGLSLCGVPMGLPTGLVIGFFNLIPFMSYILGLPLALLLSWVDDQSWVRLLAVAAVFTFGQFVEGNFITPRVVGQSLGLHAVVVMLAVLVGGTLFGVVGMLLAVPTTAVLSVFWSDLRRFYLGSDFYRRGGPDAPAAA